MAVDLSPAYPNPDTDTPTVFSQKAAAFAIWMAAMAPQLNRDLATFNAALAGGAYAFPYTFDASTADSDPGPGRLRLNTTTQNQASQIRFDLLTSAGADLTNLFNLLGNGTSVVRGAMRIVKVTDPSQWMLLDFTGLSAPTGYRNITAAVRVATSANPFANGDSLIVYFDRAGDIGTGSSVVQLAAPTIINSPVSAVTYAGAPFDVNYVKFTILVEQFAPVSSTPQLYLQFYNSNGSGNVGDSGAHYSGLLPNGGATSGTWGTQLAFGSTSGMGQAGSLNLEIDILNPSMNVYATSVNVVGSYTDGIGGTTGQGIAGSSLYNGGAITGFRLFYSGGININRGNVRVFGTKRSLI